MHVSFVVLPMPVSGDHHELGEDNGRAESVTALGGWETVSGGGEGAARLMEFVGKRKTYWNGLGVCLHQGRQGWAGEGGSHITRFETEHRKI